jgi:glycosyltransferase involved in cell wall biosynthesis
MKISAVALRGLRPHAGGGEDAEHRDELRRRGLERVQRFTWAETARQTLAVYLRVLEG